MTPPFHRLELPSGALEVSVAPGEFELSSLCGFAARRNPKRGFLFVSKVLGRYLPVRPSNLVRVQDALVDRLPEDVAGPILVVGVAEAGLALALGVHRRLVEADHDALLLNTTRYHFQRDLLVAFDEEHSHAPSHRLYQPLDPADRALLEQARTVVVVDDELTTGRTFGNLVGALHGRLPLARHYVHLVLTDWHTGDLGAVVQAPVGVRVELKALLHGRYRFRPNPRFAPRMPDVAGDGDCKASLVRCNHGRFGLRQPLGLDRLPDHPGQRVLVLGTGEFQAAALVLAEDLEARGADVWFQATTRAPVLSGGVIRSVLTFDDNYRDGVPNFLYNVDPSAYDRVYVCLETPEPPGGLIDTLNAVPIYF